MPKENSSPLKSEAARIASWCEAQYDAEEAAAKKQISLVLITVLTGIFLLLAMPRLIHEIDFLWRVDSLPRSIVEKAQVAKSQLDTQKQALHLQVADAKSEKEKIESELTTTREILTTRESTLADSLSGKMTTFRYTPDTNHIDQRTIIQTIKRRDGTYISVGFSKEPDDTENLLILYSTDGRSWTAASLKNEGNAPRGRLHDVLETDDKNLVTVGFERSSDGPETLLLLTSSDGLSWKPIRPREDNLLIKGQLLSMIEAKDNSLVAVGTGFQESAQTKRTGTPIVLRSSDGQSWKPLRPVENGNELTGRLNSILQASDGSFVAVGMEQTSDGLEAVLLLRSTDGHSWTPARPKVYNVRLYGQLESIMQATDNSFLAVGSEGFTTFESEMLLLKSTDGKTWQRIDLEELGNRISGRLDDILQDHDGTFVAVGEDIWKLGPTTEVGKAAKPAATALRNSITDKLSAIYGRGPGIWWSFAPVGEFGSYNIYTTVLLHSTDGVSWTPVRFFRDGLRVISPNEVFLVRNASSKYRIRLSGAWLDILSEEEQEGVYNNILKHQEVSPEMVFASNIWPETEGVSTIIADKVRLEGLLEQRKDILDTLEKTSENQSRTSATFAEVTNVLNHTLRQTEVIREAGQIATRIAVVGLLIYLVQILVNRYRYHLRLAKFYKARSQALRLVISDTEENGMLSKISFAELASSLSPESVHFEKLSSKPPSFSGGVDHGPTR